MSVHVATEATGQNKLWIYDDPGGRDWFNTDFKRLYALAYEALFNHQRTYLLGQRQ